MTRKSEGKKEWSNRKSLLYSIKKNLQVKKAIWEAAEKGRGKRQQIGNEIELLKSINVREIILVKVQGGQKATIWQWASQTRLNRLFSPTLGLHWSQPSSETEKAFKQIIFKWVHEFPLPSRASTSIITHYVRHPRRSSTCVPMTNPFLSPQNML